MKRVSLKPDLDVIKSLLDYNPNTGVFKWINRSGRYGRIPAGSVAGSINGQGYRYIWINGTLYCAQRLAWFISYSEWPDSMVDHINMDKDDNRIVNLRLVTDQQSTAHRTVHKRNICGLKGVSKRGKKWRTRITLNRKTIDVGYFNSKEEAHAAYVAKSLELFGEYAHP